MKQKINKHTEYVQYMMQTCSFSLFIRDFILFYIHNIYVNTLTIVRLTKRKQQQSKKKKKIYDFIICDV